MHLMSSRLGDDLFIFSGLFTKDPPDRDKDEKEYLDLGALAIRGADVPLKYRISER